MQLNHRRLDAGQAQRLRRARRTAAAMGIIALTVFMLSIAQMLWLLHHPKAHARAVKDALTYAARMAPDSVDPKIHDQRPYAA